HRHHGRHVRLRRPDDLGGRPGFPGRGAVGREAELEGVRRGDRPGAIRMARYRAAAAIALAFLAFANVAAAADECRLETRFVWEDDTPPDPTHLVSFIFTGVEDE